MGVTTLGGGLDTCCTETGDTKSGLQVQREEANGIML